MLIKVGGDLGQFGTEIWGIRCTGGYFGKDWGEVIQWTQE
jgi:hypothetical protein